MRQMCFRLCPLLLAMLMVAGCVRVAPRAYEFRYRVLEAGAPLPATMTSPLPLELLTERILPPGEFNRELDRLTQEGFLLHEVQRVDATNYHVFTFRRPIREGYRPTLAPMEFTGVFMPVSPQRPAIYYAFTPRYRGYDVTVFGVGPTPATFSAEWKDGLLRANVGSTRHTFGLVGDGRGITHIMETMRAGVLDRQVTSLAPMGH